MDDKGDLVSFQQGGISSTLPCPARNKVGRAKNIPGEYLFPRFVVCVFRLLIGNSKATIQHTLINFALFSGCR